MAIDGESRVLWGLYGTIPGDMQDSGRAEHYAVRAILPLCLPGVVLLTDHFNIVEGVDKGRAWCEDPSRKYCDLWCQIWRMIDEIGGVGSQGVRFKYVPAHTKEREGEAISTRWARIGNKWADALANRGRKLAEGAAYWKIVETCKTVLEGVQAVLY